MHGSGDAATIKSTEGAVHRVLVDLETEAYIAGQRTGKGNDVNPVKLE